MSMDSKTSEIKNNTSELIDTLNKVIYDVNLLIEKIKNLEDFKNSRTRRFLNFAPIRWIWKADDVEIKKNLSILNQEVKKMEHEIIKLNERTVRLESKTKSL